MMSSPAFGLVIPLLMWLSLWYCLSPHIFYMCSFDSIHLSVSFLVLVSISVQYSVLIHPHICSSKGTLHVMPHNTHMTLLTNHSQFQICHANLSHPLHQFHLRTHQPLKHCYHSFTMIPKIPGTQFHTQTWISPIPPLIFLSKVQFLFHRNVMLVQEHEQELLSFLYSSSCCVLTHIPIFPIPNGSAL